MDRRKTLEPLARIFLAGSILTSTVLPNQRQLNPGANTIPAICSGLEKSSQNAANAYADLLRCYTDSQGNFLNYDADSQIRKAPDAWTFYQVVSASVILDRLYQGQEPYRSEMIRRLDEIARFWDQSPLFGKPGYNPNILSSEIMQISYKKFHDDNAWFGLAFMEGYQQTGNRQYLEKAKEIFEFNINDYHKEDELSHGGIPWVEHHYPWDKDVEFGVVSNGTTAVLAALIAQAEGQNDYYYQWAVKLYDWTSRNLRNEKGLYFDKFVGEGNDATIDETVWSYNQGTMIRAGVLLFQLSGDEKYFNEAEQTAKEALKCDFTQNPPKFNAIYAEGLVALADMTKDESLKEDISLGLTGLHPGDVSNGDLDLITQAANVKLKGIIESFSKSQAGHNSLGSKSGSPFTPSTEHSQLLIVPLS